MWTEIKKIFFCNSDSDFPIHFPTFILVKKREQYFKPDIYFLYTYQLLYILRQSTI